MKPPFDPVCDAPAPEAGLVPAFGPAAVAAAQLVWDEQGVPRSEVYGDVYFSTADGLAESRAVFLQGCDLPQAWAGRQRFVVGELGLGTSLNILALLQLWQAHRPQGGQLRIFSIEAHPLTRQEARRALATWPELAPLAALILDQWPGQARGLHRIDLPSLGAVIDVAIMDVADALEAWSGEADAWFLDGFSPAVNPQMWCQPVFTLLAARSAPGARVATFTVAGVVRRGLAAAGFIVDKRPGFGRKRERLEAVWPGPVAPPSPRTPKIAIIGAGIAGASLLRAFGRLGLEPQLFEAVGAGAGGSGNPAALMTPRLDAGGGPAGILHAQAFAHAAALYRRDVPQAVIAEGVLQLQSAPTDADRFDRLAQQDLFEPDDLVRLDAEAASWRLGEVSPVGGLWMTRALTLEPEKVLQAWLGSALSKTEGPSEVATLVAVSQGWSLRDGAGRELMVADEVCIAAGAGAAALLAELPLQSIRGQASWSGDRPATQAAAWGGYVAPTRDGVLFGSTHDRGQTSTEVRAQDDLRNLVALAKGLPHLAASMEGQRMQARASLRAAVPDQMPLVGQVPERPGLWVLGALGSRGFTLAPLLAEHVAARVLGLPSPLPRTVAAAVDPGRFAARRLRRR
jgi:tRNA 5-methylaminomethyl-2-thiouridine biosynthesis bifunctional protein